MKLIIAEKPELGRAIANVVVENQHSSNGYISGDNDYIVVSAMGHLLKLQEPEEIDEKYKDKKVLPVDGTKAKLVPDMIKDEKNNNSYKAERLKLIGELMEEADVVINAGDPDDEGQLLIDEIIEYFGYKGDVKRVLINDNSPEKIKESFENLEDNEKYKSIGIAAGARRLADYCFGINESRLAYTKLGRFLSVGRVMTPTLALVVNRDKEIESHKKQEYLEFIADFENEENKFSLKFFPNDEFKEKLEYIDEKYIDISSREQLEEIKSKINNKYLDFSVVSKQKLEYPPLPYNLNELQADMNSKYNYSLKKTLDITQQLRDQFRLITYNRSDCQYLNTLHYDEAPDVLGIALNNINENLNLDFKLKSKCFNDENVTAHHAIIPQKTKIDLSELNQDQKNVYTAIVERYAMQFLKPVVKEEYKLNGKIAEGEFKGTFYKTIDYGYQNELYDKNIKKNDLSQTFNLDGISELTMKNSEANIVVKESKPKSRYTQASLIKDMSSISKYVKDPEIKSILLRKDEDKKGEKGGIGTPATRAAIVDKLFTKGYLREEKNKIISTELGRNFINLLPETITSPDLTAKWFLLQEEIKDGNGKIGDIADSVLNDFANRMDTAYKGVDKEVFSQARENYGKCPLCGKEVYKGKYGFYCSGYKEGCQFKLGNEAKYFNNKVTITDARAKKLINGESISVSVVGKSGSKYNEKLKLTFNKVGDKVYSNLSKK